jgi:multidrug efflux pump subunit AcrB
MRKRYRPVIGAAVAWMLAALPALLLVFDGAKRWS